MDTEPEPEPDLGAADPDEILRAKYLEYCSAQMADLLLYLTPDQIYLLAEKATREEGRPTPPDRSYLSMVRNATRWLSMRVALPPFDVWLTDYRQHTDRYESYLMGLWEADVATAPKLDA